MNKKYNAPKLDKVEFDDIILASGQSAWQDNGEVIDPDPSDHWGTVFF